MTELSVPTKIRMDASLANFADKYIFMTGGHYGGFHSETDVYEVSTNTWTKAPPLNIARGDASTCAFNNEMLYVYGGKADYEKFAEKIEKLDARRFISGDRDVAWELIEVQTTEVLTRTFGFMAQVN